MMKTVPIIKKILFNKPVSFEPYIKAPYQVVKSNEFCRNAKQVGEEKFYNLVKKSLEKEPIDKGDMNNIFKLAGIQGYLLRVRNDYMQATNALENMFFDVLHLTPLKQNPNHIVGKVGFVEILKEIPGISIKDNKFIKELAKLPQKSFDDFVKKVEQNKKEGFYLDGSGANTLLDIKNQHLEPIDSFVNSFENDGTIKEVLSSLLGNYYHSFNQEGAKQNAEVVLKKALKALSSNAGSSFRGLNTLKQELVSDNKKLVIKLFSRINLLKSLIDNSKTNVRKSFLIKLLKGKQQKFDNLVEESKISLEDINLSPFNFT